MMLSASSQKSQRVLQKSRFDNIQYRKVDLIKTAVTKKRREFIFYSFQVTYGEDSNIF